VLNPFKGRTQQKQQQEAIPTISEAELWQLLEGEQTVPLVVIFSATWCGPCKIMMARLESLLKTLGPGGMRAVKIDTDDCPDLASELKVCSFQMWGGGAGAECVCTHVMLAA
jgi:thioredoxin 1